MGLLCNFAADFGLKRLLRRGAILDWASLSIHSRLWNWPRVMSKGSISDSGPGP